MAQKSKGNRQNNVVQPPPGISTDDWADTPISIRGFVSKLRETKSEDWDNTPVSVRKYVTTQFEVKKEYKNRFPLLTILINLGLIVLITYLLEGIGLGIFPCITPHIVGPLSVSICVLIFLHLALRPLARNQSNQMGEIKFLGYTLSLSVITAFLFEMQVWKLKSSLLFLLLFVSVVAGAILNLSSNSPFYTPDELSAFQGFIINRFHKEGFKEGIPVGGKLTLTVNEKVLIQARFRKETDRSCVWQSNMSRPSSHLGCSIILDEVSKPGPDTLTVLIQSACGTREFLGMHVDILP